MGCICQRQVVNGEINFNAKQEEDNDIDKEKEALKKKKTEIKQKEATKINLFEYNQTAFNCINLARTKPAVFAETIESSMTRIKQIEKAGKKETIFKIGSTPLYLARGEEAFRESIEMLKTMEPVPGLQWKEEIAIEVGDDEAGKHINYLRSEAKKRGGIAYSTKEVGISPELVVVYMIVDDANQKQNNANLKRKAILNSKLKYCAVTSKLDSKGVCAFFSFGEEEKK